MTASNERDPYAELGIVRSAGDRAIRRAFHAKARTHHPDLGGQVAAMARLNTAYELLKDPVRRAAYDASHPADAGSVPGSGVGSRTNGPAGTPHWTGAAGPPPGRPSGPVLDFGIYAGWSLGEIARHDAGYLVWVSERKEGQPYLDAIARHVAPYRQAPPDAPRGRRR